MRTQPSSDLHHGKIYRHSIPRYSREMFDLLNIGDVFLYENKRTVKITNSYFNIYDKNNNFCRMVNAMVESGGELINVPSGMVISVLCGGE